MAAKEREEPVEPDNLTQHETIDDSDLGVIEQSTEHFPVLMRFSRLKESTVDVLRKRETTVGRDPNVDIRVEHSSASRTHATLVYENMTQHERLPSIVVYDNESRNGTYVNGLRIEGPKPLKSGDLLRIGHDTFVYLVRNKTELDYELRLRSDIRRSHRMLPEQRFPVEFPVEATFVFPEETFQPHSLAGSARDLSFMGMRVSFADFPQPLYSRLLKGQRFVRIDAKLPGEETSVRLHSRLMWIDYSAEPDMRPTAIGVEFERITPDLRHAIRIAIERMMPDHISVPGFGLGRDRDTD